MEPASRESSKCPISSKVCNKGHAESAWLSFWGRTPAVADSARSSEQGRHGMGVEEEDEVL